MGIHENMFLKQLRIPRGFNPTAEENAVVRPHLIRHCAEASELVLLLRC